MMRINQKLKEGIVNTIKRREFSNISKLSNKDKLIKFYIAGYVLSMPLFTGYYYYNTYNIFLAPNLWEDRPYTIFFFKSVYSIADSIMLSFIWPIATPQLINKLIEEYRIKKDKDLE